MSGRVLVPWWLVGGGLERKRVTIDALADRMPERRWVLVGDDAGHDPRLFAEFARYRPERVMVIALRQVLDVDPPEIGASPRPEPVAGVAEIEARCQECSGGRRGLLGGN
jgi:phosphatidate phosphatase APP1